MIKPVQVGDRLIGPGHPTYVIAEAGVNHKGSLSAARRMIDEAKRAGADAIKFQTYKADKLVTRTAPRYWDDPEASGTQFAIFKRSDCFGEAEYKTLYDHAQAVGITWLSTAFDLDAVKFLDEMGMPAFKVASADLTNYPLLMAVAQTGKPVLLSTGASTLVEVHASVDFLRRHGGRELVLLYCVLSYPTADEDANLLRIRTLQQDFPGISIGFSDHTVPDDCVIVPAAAVAVGAQVIEKHFTLDRSLPGDDHYLSVDPVQLATMVRNFRVIEKALGNPDFGVQTSEEQARMYARRSIVSAVFIPMGTTITADMLIMKRPGTGIAPSEVPHLVGRTATVDIQPDTMISWDMVS
ncbi:MAG: N-acetylneuraminate synthase family protein [Anaerolineae bacterium]|nr:N-acetylneuraminate synthase family protein [Anaerolineae bacterium]